jgi:GNAT superfamily N-acetyltransferase
MEDMTNRIQVVHAAGTDVVRVADLIAAAFHDLEVAAWQIPDGQLRGTALPMMFEGLIRYALSRGSVEVMDDLSAAAVWTVEAGEATPTPRPPDGLLAATLGEAIERVHAFDLALHEREPFGSAFEKLALLAVRPELQNRGLGSELLAYHLAGLDRRLMPAYLEASNERSRELYARFGFRDHGEPIRLPGGPLMYPMLRQPIPAR